jgi:hypothetical protein
VCVCANMETVCLLVMSECGEGGDCLSLGCE